MRTIKTTSYDRVIKDPRSRGAFQAASLALGFRLRRLQCHTMSVTDSLREAGRLFQLYDRMRAHHPDKGRLIPIQPDIKAVMVTWLFRNDFEGPKLDALLEHFASSGRTSIKVFVAGCSTGREAFTWALLLKRALPEGFKISIFAVDGDLHLLQLAQKARDKGIDFGDDSVNMFDEGPPQGYEKFFVHQGGRRWKLVPQVAETIDFGILDINKYDPALIKGFDIISCANVLRHYYHFPSGLQNDGMPGSARVIRTYDKLRMSLKDQRSLLFINFRERDWHIVGRDAEFSRLKT